MNAQPVPKPRTCSQGKMATVDGPKKPIPLPRVRRPKETNDNEDSQNNFKSIYNNVSVSLSSPSSSSLSEGNILETTDEHYYATILEKPDPIPQTIVQEQKGKNRNGHDKRREIFKTISSDLQERRRNVFASIDRGKRSARECLDRATKQAEQQLNRHLHKRFTSITKESSDIQNRVVSLPATTDSISLPDNENLGLNSALCSKQENLTSIEDSSWRCSPPPPEYPPPPLPNEANYDVPSSVNSLRFNTSNSSSSSNRFSSCDASYLNEEIRSDHNFTIASDTLSLSNRSDPDIDDLSMSDFNDFSSIPRGKQTTRADSWSYYDGLSNRSTGTSSIEPVYSNDVNENFIDSIYCNDNVDNAQSGAIVEESLSSRISDLSFLTRNSLYENCTITLPDSNKDSEISQRLKHSNSLLREFDPLAVTNCAESIPAENDLLLLESLLEGDTYGTLGREEPALQTNYHDDIEEDYPDSDEDNTNVFYGLETVADQAQSTTRTPVIKITNVQHEPILEIPQKLKNSANDLSRESNSSGTNSNTSFPLSPKINLSAAQYESLAESISDSSNLVHPPCKIIENQPVAEEKERSGINKNLVRFQNLWRRASFKNKDISKSTECITKPLLNGVHVAHKGKLYRCTDIFFTTKQENLQVRWCKIDDGKLVCHADSAMMIIKEVVPIENLMSIQIVHNHKLSVDGSDLHCFELNMQTSKNRVSYLFASNTAIERNQWAQKLVEVLTNCFPAKHVVDFTRVGWCFVKNGVSGNWFSTWILLRHRSLIYYFPQENNLQILDLRKARCITLRDSDESCKNIVCKDGPIALVDSPQYCLHLRMETARETKIWRHEIHYAATRNGPALHQQQLTKDNIPTLVDKCLNFVYTHGSLSEGIYRRSGSSVVMNKLLTAFRVDAWLVQLSPQEYTEHDVAGTLKRFFRDLPEPLLTNKLSPYFVRASAKTNLQEKITSYKKYLSVLPMINAATLKKLIGHLHFIQSQQDKNLMSVDNLSSIWGPTLIKSHSDIPEYSTVDYNVILDLITMYRQLYELSEEELHKEQIMLTVLMRYHTAANSIAPIKPSGNIRMWIQLDNSTKDCVAVAVTPKMKANDICNLMSSKMGVSCHELIIEESVLQGQLTRPMHFSESILDTVLRWGYWNDEDRKDNTLIVKRDNFFREVAPFACAPCTMSGELKFADTKSKNFKNFTFDFNQAKLTYYKDKSGATRICEWKIEEIVWYLGFENKRNPQSLWSVTFVPRNNKPKRSKENPYFGCTIAGSNTRDMLKWLGVMLCSEHPRGVLAPARLVLE